MKIIFVNTFDILGGAARASYRLYTELKKVGVTSRMFVQSKFSDDASVSCPPPIWRRGISLIRPILDTLPLGLYRNRKRIIFSPSILPDRLAYKAAAENPDLIHLHWVCNGFLGIKTLNHFKKPLVWTLHDMWAFTGGCHYNEGCGRYKDSCGNCPQLGSQKQNDLSRWVWRRKKRAWQGLNITVVTPSRWLAECAKTSSLFKGCRVEVIPNGLDTELYKPIDKHIARGIWNLPENKKLILFGAMDATGDKRKGFQYFEPALKTLATSALREKVELVVFGSSKPANPPNFGLKTHYLGQLHDDVSLALLYAIADVFVAPSVQDNLPNTVMEATACGTPCVAFNIGGMPDMIEHEKNGYLAKPFDHGDLTKGIAWVLENEERWKAMAHRARQKAEDEFAIEKVAKRYEDLYKEIINGIPQ